MTIYDFSHPYHDLDIPTTKTEKIIRHALILFRTSLLNFRQSGMTWHEIADLTDLDYSSAYKFGHNLDKRMSWGMAIKQILFVANNATPEEGKQLRQAINRVQSKIEYFATSPLPARALETRYGIPSLRMSYQQFQRVNKRKRTHADDNPIWSLNHEKVLRLFSYLATNDTFFKRDQIYRQILEYLDQDTMQQKKLVTTFLKMGNLYTYRELSHITGINLAQFSIWRHATDDYWQNVTLKPDTLIAIWQFIHQ